MVIMPSTWLNSYWQTALVLVSSIDSVLQFIPTHMKPKLKSSALWTSPHRDENTTSLLISPNAFWFTCGTASSSRLQSAPFYHSNKLRSMNEHHPNAIPPFVTPLLHRRHLMDQDCGIPVAFVNVGVFTLLMMRTASSHFYESPSCITGSHITLLN